MLRPVVLFPNLASRTKTSLDPVTTAGTLSQRLATSSSRASLSIGYQQQIKNFWLNIRIRLFWLRTFWDAMEHLVDHHELAEIQGSIPKTPWLGFDHDETQEYAVVPFEEYPLQRGWTVEQLHYLRLGGFKDTNPASALAMLQSWLFFGLLESAFQEHFSSHSFIFTTNPETATAGCSRVLNTKNLRSYYKSWNENFLDFTAERKTNLSRSFAQSLHGPRDWVLFLAVKLRPRTAEYNALPLSAAMNATLRTTLLLLELLGKATPQSFQDPFVNFLPDIDPGNEIEDRLREQKWCPWSFKVLMNKYGPSIATYATLLKPSENSFVSHGKCSRDDCVAYNVDVPTYEPRHLNEGCSCEKIGPTISEVYETLEGGTFPLLDGEALLNSELDGMLVVKPYTPGTEFVAFSHVWSDGLGSVTERGLPRCQVVHMSKLIKVISGSTLFWVDSLCVPQDPATRTAAITKMASTYNSASTTLVLDAGIRKCSLARPLEEIIIRILASTWMRRLWTLQEGALAGRLVFLLRDYFLDIRELLSRLFTSGFSGPIAAAALIELVSFRRENYVSKPAHINYLRRLAGYRTSSRLDDETLAIAPLFHIDVKRLTPYKGERRKIEFWNCLNTVPNDIAFSDAPRLTTPGYRWAPNTLLYGDGHIFGPKASTITDKGIIGDFMILGLEKRLKVEMRSSYQLHDVITRKAFRLFDYREADSGNLTQTHTTVCDAIAIKTQPTGELIPGTAISLVQGKNLDGDEKIDDGLVSYEYRDKLMIAADEFSELVHWDNLPADALIVRSVTMTIRIS